MTQDPPLSRQTRSFIVLLAVLQGGLLYLAQKGTREGWWPFDALGGRICWYTLVLCVPTAMTLSVVELRDRRFWQHAAGLFVVFAGLSVWAAWNATGAPDLQSSAVLMPFGLSTAIALFIALPWLQVRLAHGRWRADYPALFENAWQNAITLLLTLAFTGVCWGVLTLWSSLFSLVQINFFRELFREDAFIHLVTGAIAGFGILIGRTQQRAVQVTRQLLITAFKGLLPLLAFIALIFAATLPFTGLAPLWKTRTAAGVLLSLVALFVVFLNAVYQDGRAPRPYPAWLRRAIEAALLLMPVYAALALVALWLRIDQYGWTPERFWGGLAAMTALCYVLGYGWAVVRPDGTWLARLERVNVRMSWAVIAVILLANTPALDSWRWVVSSQAGRMRAEAPKVETDDARYLRFMAGRRGYAALQTLHRDPAYRGSPEDLAALQRVLDSDNPWSASPRKREDHKKITTLAELQGHIALAKGSASPEADWWQALLDGKIKGLDCTRRGEDCVALRRDLDGDGLDDVLLCAIHANDNIECVLHAASDGRWRDAGELNYWAGSHARDTIAALRAGDMRAERPRWPDLSLGDGDPHRIQETTEARAKVRLHHEEDSP